MAGIVRAMKRHGLTAKPALRLVNTIRSGDVDYYMFDLSGTGRHYTIAKHDFWRGGGVDSFPDFQQRAIVVGAEPTNSSPPPPPPPAEPPAEPEPAPTAPAAIEYVRVRDMQQGDVVVALNAPKGRHREVIRVVPGAPTCAMHYVWEGQAALRTSQHVPGAKFILVRRPQA
ncbi:hypothetical protein PTW37_10095 [Arthrobacter agilis]|uniref:hypothetical protein n=1 Tax=Arthrobacter agilis TaxID=37921 RepID=UPI002366DDE9|nr:hypothetical protein [Arthrobacter agilis]WDF32225.1 hypothetical protein PTW37_10095 [Arthrobacter agilis]